MHLFISYAKKDTRELALNLADALNALDGITAWVDKSLRAGKAWELEIQKQIDRCDAMIVLYSPDLNRHKDGADESYVLTEIHYAKRIVRKQIIPVMAQATEPPMSLMLEQYIDFAGLNLTVDGLVNALCDELELELDNKKSSTAKPSIAVEPPKTQDIIEIARNFKGKHNSDWTPVIRTFKINGLSLDMCLVPVGSFMMGSNNGEDDEKPVHPQTIEHPYWIGLHPITNAQWRFAVENSKNAVKIPDWADWYNDKVKSLHPVVGVTWHQVQDFVKWLGNDWHLPSEVQWEYSARGIDNLEYPFGNEFKSDLVVYAENSNSSTATVGGRPQGTSWIGAQDMAGNVWEWNSSLHKAYPYKLDDGREDLSSNGLRVLRGGSWADFYNLSSRAAYRDLVNPFSWDYDRGFRCVCAPHSRP